MTPSNYDLPADIADQREWACETLALPPDIRPDEFQLAILKYLARNDFVPSEHDHDAIDLLVPREPASHLTIPLGYYRERESDVRAQVDRFAQAFFDLQIAERNEQWEHLRRLSDPWPALRLWLTRIQPALNIDLPSSPPSTPDVCAFAKFVSRQFTTCPGHHDPDFWTQRTSQFADKKHWQIVARKYQRHFPEQARLFDPWVAEFARFSTASRRPWFQQIWSLWETNINSLSPGDANPSKAYPVLAAIWIVVVIFVGILSSVMRDPATSQDKSRGYFPPNYQAITHRFSKDQAVQREMQQAYANWKDRRGIALQHAGDPPDIQRLRQLGDRASPAEQAEVQKHDRLHELTRSMTVKEPASISLGEIAKDLPLFPRDIQVIFLLRDHASAKDLKKLREYLERSDPVTPNAPTSQSGKPQTDTDDRPPPPEVPTSSPDS